ncbi:DNA-binding transcriptional ArsR family regulator [Murinocardiopsis flavida]|uniref:DNA-binding transcriptional ArsR family regulator n=1 Tax=Murinocardiopsis flavida TaxID=645275 RepID=A0A2P8CPM5_9ACTN|nr:winged helix-turn-helix domain-containing protein [Murinocardiopsis flavida]PSK86901.1 DNA-binding transcriptional ArsR family regulator [Murinocardiopsis flavida]
MLRIHFGPEDIARLRVASEPDPMWELVVSLHRFQTRRGRAVVLDWFDEARREVPRRGLADTVRTTLLPIAPFSAYFPDFLTPDEARHGFDAALDAISATPPARLDHEIGKLARYREVPTWAKGLASGERRPREDLRAAMRSYHDVAIAPYWEDIRADVDSDRVRRSRAILDGWTHGLLSSFEPLMRWEPPVLSAAYPVESDLHLNGRGLRLVPSYFCWKHPVALADPGLPPVLVYPLHNGMVRARRGGAADAGRVLTALLGATRAAVLDAVALGLTTSELAARLAVSDSVVSHHTRILRDAGLIVSTRDRQNVLHTITRPGRELLNTKSPDWQV